MSLDDRRRAALDRLEHAREAADGGAHDRVPALLLAARAELDDGELTSLARRYAEFFELPPIVESSPRGVAAWLDAEAGARVDAIHRRLIAGYRAAGGEWEGVAMEQAFLLEPSMAHRQVFADWLQMRADPRGEFIALQMAYADAGLDARGRARMEQLLRVHVEDWARPFYDRGAAVSMFRRGFPAVVDQRLATVAQLAELGCHWRTVTRIVGRDAPQLRECRHVRAAAKLGSTRRE